MAVFLSHPDINNNTVDEMGYTALQRTVYHAGHPFDPDPGILNLDHEMLDRLLQSGLADLYAKDMNGLTPVDLAIKDRNFSVARKILGTANCELRLCDAKGEAPLERTRGQVDTPTRRSRRGKIAHRSRASSFP